MSLVKSSTSAWHWREKPFNERRNAPEHRPSGWYLDLQSAVHVRSAHDKRFVFAAFTFHVKPMLRSKLSQFLEALGC